MPNIKGQYDACTHTKPCLVSEELRSRCPPAVGPLLRLAAPPFLYLISDTVCSLFLLFFRGLFCLT